MSKRKNMILVSTLTAVISVTSLPVFAQNVPSTAEGQVVNGTSYVTVGEDLKKPAVSSVSSLSYTQVRVTFSEPVDQAAAEMISNYSINQAYGTRAPLAISGASLDSTGQTVTLTTAEQTGNILYRINISNVGDLAGNIMDSSQSAFVGRAPEVTPPTNPDNIAIDSVTAATNTSVNVTFNTPVDISNAVFSIKLKYGTKAPLNITGIVLSQDGKTVTLTTESQQTALYTLTVTSIKAASSSAAGTATVEQAFVGRSS